MGELLWHPHFLLLEKTRATNLQGAPIDRCLDSPTWQCLEIPYRWNEQLPFPGRCDQRTGNHMLTIPLNRRGLGESLLLWESLCHGDADQALLAPGERTCLVKNDAIEGTCSLKR